MKIAFPAERDEGMESPVYGHFGSAPCFLIILNSLCRTPAQGMAPTAAAPIKLKGSNR
jgi:hypothetical protein